MLTNEHLNQLFTYLDGQERLTRANLIGIGIVCGLKLRYNSTGPAISLSKGCGITSEGYLIIQSEDADFVSYRKIEEDLKYPPFKTVNLPGPAPALITQYPLWELFPKDEPNTTALNTPATFLNDKAVVLFLELNNAKLRNCSPNNCDDKGAEVTLKVRPLLIEQANLLAIIARENQLSRALTPNELEAALLTRLNLPDLRLPRYDVPNTNPVTSNTVLAAFHNLFRADQLVTSLGQALSAAFQAFKPLLQQETDPFGTFGDTFGFLQKAPLSTVQVRFLPYYYDFFDDLIRAYDEFRQVGLNLLCACCPPNGLFPQHLIAGLLLPATTSNPGVYRHSFVPSPAVGGCEEREADLRQLFQRLVEMIARFNLTPSLPKPSPNSLTDSQIRITPSTLSDAPLSRKAIPYYYQQTEPTPLFQLWNTEKTRRNRANQNLSYRSDEYSPAAPAFIIDPLRYDLEAYNFLRIEGHLGKGYQPVLRTLLTLRNQFRLPVDIIALRTGAFDETIAVDIRNESARFQDLDATYDAFREELLSALAEGIRFLYGVPNPSGTDPAGTAKLPLLANYMGSNVGYAAGTVGAWYEKNLDALAKRPYIDIDQNNITDLTVGLTVYCPLFAGLPFPNQDVYAHVVSIFYFTKLAEILPEELDELGFADFENRYQDLMGLTRYFRNEEKDKVPTDLKPFWPQIDLIDHFDEVLFACKLEPIRSLFEAYKQRLKALKQQQFLSTFLQNNPGIQHKAGVPMGGTFILVYHDDPDPVTPVLTARLQNLGNIASVSVNRPLSTTLRQADFNSASINTVAIADTLSKISKDKVLANNDDIRLILGALTGFVPPKTINFPPTQEDAAKKIIDAAVGELADGTIIADFFLPYLVRSGGTPVQFVLPKTKPSFTTRIGCTDANGQAEVTVTPTGGEGPYSVKIDDTDFAPLDGVLSLPAGIRTLVIQDAEATASNPQTIQIGNQLLLGEPEYQCNEDGSNTYIATFMVRGGKAPYKANRGSFATTNQYTSKAIDGDTDVDITITDSNGCKAAVTLRHSCLPPLAFTVQVGCTTPNNAAPVTLLPTGGTPPYKVQIDQQTPISVDGPVSLAVGAHRIIITDDVGAVAAEQQVSIPARLTLTVSDADFSCDNNTYRARVHVTGGVPPYFYKRAAGEQQFNDAVFATDAFPSGTETTIEVRDSSGCPATTLRIRHTCENPCNLPLDGLSRQCAYRLWLQPPTANAPYKNYQQQAQITLRFNNENLVVPNAGQLLQLDLQALNNDFDGAVGDAVKKLNKAINKVIKDKFGDIGRDRLQISYAPNPQKDPFSLLLIEYFRKDDQTFDKFTIEFMYSIIKPSRTFDKIRVRYTNDPNATDIPAPNVGTIVRYPTVTGEQKTITIPPFACADRNQCSNSAYTSICQQTDVQVSITAADFLAGSISGVNPRSVVAWIWDFPLTETQEPFYSGQKIGRQPVQGAPLAKLTAITKDGCAFSTQQNIG